MAPLPKRRFSTRRSGKREQATMATQLPERNRCPKCSHAKLPHRACPKCGFYK